MTWQKVQFCLFAFTSLLDRITYANALSVEIKLVVNTENNNGRKRGRPGSIVSVHTSEDYPSLPEKNATLRDGDDNTLDFRQRIYMLDEFKFDISQHISLSEGAKQTIRHEQHTFKQQRQQYGASKALPKNENIWVGRTNNIDQKIKGDDSVDFGDSENEHDSSSNDNAIGEAILFYDIETSLLVGSLVTKDSFYNIVIFANGVGEFTETSFNDFTPEEDALIIDEKTNKIVPFETGSKRRNLRNHSRNNEKNHQKNLRKDKKHQQAALPLPSPASSSLLRSRNLQQDQPQELQGQDQNKPTYVDVIIPYTKRAMCYVATGWDTRDCDDNEINRSFIESRARLAVAQANVAMEMAGIPNSLVQQRLVLTYLEQHFDEYGLSADDVLTRLFETNDGCMDNIHEIRNEYGGDLVSLFTYGTFTGIGFVGSGTSPSKIGFSSTNVVSATGYYTYAHETGHNFGLLHDRGRAFGAESCPDKECCRSYCTGYGYKNSSSPFRSLMTYSENNESTPRVLCYSSNITTFAYNGRGYSIGDSWNTNAYEILKNYHNIANYRNATSETSLLPPTLSPRDILNLPDRMIPQHDEIQGECFSASTTVQVKNKGTTSIQNVRVGDQVLAGGGKYEAVYTIDHYSTNKQTNFLQIYTTSSNRSSISQTSEFDGNIKEEATIMVAQQFVSKDDEVPPLQQQQPLEVTYQHMVFIHGKLNPIPASGLQIGDYVQSIYGPRRITKILDIVRYDGYYNPLTISGTVVVNQQGIIASTYSTNYDLLFPSKGVSHDSINSENSEYFTISIDTQVSMLRYKTPSTLITITMPYQRIFHTLLQPMKYFCLHINPNLCKLPEPSHRSEEKEEGNFLKPNSNNGSIDNCNKDTSDDQMVTYSRFGRYLLNKIQNNQLCKDIIFTTIAVVVNLIDICILSIRHLSHYYFVYCSSLLLLFSIFIITIDPVMLYDQIGSKQNHNKRNAKTNSHVFILTAPSFLLCILYRI